jgi:hypothetical protein
MVLQRAINTGDWDLDSCDWHFRSLREFLG